MGKQGLSIPIGIIAVTLAIVAFSSMEQDSEVDEIKIVANLPISGPGSGIGIEQRDGLTLAVKEINDKGGIKGKQIDLIIEDNQTDLEKAKEIFNFQEQSYEPLLHISSLSFISTGLSEMAEKEKVVLVSLSAVAPDVTAGKEWTFRYFPMAEDEAKPILKILDDLEIKSLGILYLDDEFGRSIAKEVGENFSLKGNVVDESFQNNQKEFLENIERLKDQEAIYLVGFPDHVKIILKEIDQSNYEGEILMSSDGAMFDIFQMAEAQNVHIAAPLVYNTKLKLANEVGIRFENKFDKQLDHNGANSYDVIRIIKGLLDDKEITRENLKESFDSGFIYTGIFGTIYGYPQNQDIKFGLYPSKIVDGELKFESTQGAMSSEVEQ